MADTRSYGNKSDITAPAMDATALTKSDSTVLTPTRGLYVGGGGDVAVTMLGGTVVTFSAVPTGAFMPIQITKLMSTNTSATLVLALY